MDIDLATFVAAMLHNSGGIVEVPYDLVVGDHFAGKQIAIDIINDGATLRLSLVEAGDIIDAEIVED